MSDFARKTRELSRSTTLYYGYVPDIDPYANVAVLSGQRMRIPRYQIPKSSPFENANLYRYQASGNYTALLGTGGPMQVMLTRGMGSGPLVPNGVILRLQVYNPSASVPCYFLPLPLWIQTIQYFTPSGAPIAPQDGQGLWENIVESYDSDDWHMLQKALGANNAYSAGDPILPLQTATFYIPLIGNPLSCGKVLLAALAGDLQVLVNFFPPSTFQLSGGTCNLVNATIDTLQAQLGEQSLSNCIATYKMAQHDWFFPYERVMTINQNWNASSLYALPLVGIAGDVTFIRFCMYNTLTGLDLCDPVPITSFSFLNNAGELISGMNVIEEQFNRLYMQKDYFKGRASRRTKKYAYVWSNKVTGAQDLIANGTKYGAYPFTNKETLNITTAPAGTNEVLTFTPSSAPVSGTFQIMWTNPDIGAMTTPAIAYNATAATIQAAINTLINFTGTCTVTGTMATAVVVTFTGAGYQNRPMAADGFTMSIVNAMIGTTYTMGVGAVITTAGVPGITSGNSYILKIFAYTSSVGHQLTNGGIDTQNSG